MSLGSLTKILLLKNGQRTSRTTTVLQAMTYLVIKVQAPVKLTTLRRFKLTSVGRFNLTTSGRSKLTT